MSHFKLLTLLVLAVVLAGCSQKTIPDPDPTDTTYGADEDMGTSTSGMTVRILTAARVSARIRPRASSPW